MSTLSINLSNKSHVLGGIIVSDGSIRIGEFEEKFQTSLSYWNRERYFCQWKEALTRLIDGEKCSAIITNMYDPSIANFIIWWPIYAIGEKVHFQNQVLLLAELEKTFDESDPYKSIPKRETISEDGEKISEWIIGISEVEPCLGLLTNH
ncbi:hypothetical protein [Hoeflea poritis]|uniref:CdiI C-terminal domain-containing protein n=1 Tax=Hoeflea poritis TaxID=2993659 RepID=A0ABT4VW42_9HYPH|nr:hypothetical protein [Hoeflea poritis]MDA4848908.1 hypothetical protein [Hoeflea poritis]